jgi:hypothetical protein
MLRKVVRTRLFEVKATPVTVTDDFGHPEVPATVALPLRLNSVFPLT